MIRVLLVDDHEMLREGIRTRLREVKDIRIVGEAAGLRDMMLQLRRMELDVVVLDIKLGDDSGLSVLRKIRSLRPAARIVILTMYDQAQYVQHALKNGARGYVVKGAPIEELVEAIRAVHAGETFVSPSLSGRMTVRRKGRGTVAIDLLSQRERQVFKQLARGLSVKEVALQIGVSAKSVTTYRTRLMEKLKLSTNADIVRAAIQVPL